jgi:cobalt/nickel transport system permease protein
MLLPKWFQSNDEWMYRPDPGGAGKRVRLLFLDRTLKAIAGLLADFIFADRYAGKAGFLQGLDARAKLIGFLILIVGASLLHSVPFLYGLSAMALIFAVLSGVDAGFFLKRVWLVLPLFSGVIALPATLNIFTPGESLWVIGSIGEEIRFGPYALPAEIAFTKQGVLSALLLVGRVGASLSLILLLTVTTPWADLLKAFRCLGVPKIYVQTLNMALRYILLLARIVEDMHIAKKSRMIRPGKTRTEQRWIAGQVGFLFNRSMQLSSDVHRAMVARGYQGEVRILSVFHLQKKDYGWMISCAGIAGILIYLGR